MQLSSEEGLPETAVNARKRSLMKACDHQPFKKNFYFPHSSLQIGSNSFASLELSTRHVKKSV